MDTTIETLKARVMAAQRMVEALNEPRGSEGSRDWAMSIPARPDHDPDLVISEGLRAGWAALGDLERLRAEVERLRNVEQWAAAVVAGLSVTGTVGPNVRRELEAALGFTAAP